MHCPNCGSSKKLAVKETRRTPEGNIRRRRRCPSCAHDFTTVEQISGSQVRVRKSDGRFQLFDRGKLRRGIVKAAVRPHHVDRLSELVDSIAQEAAQEAVDGIIPTEQVSSIVLKHLKEFDPVTHVRFALTQLGRRDKPDTKGGWRSVADLRRWLRDAYPELEHFRPSTKLSHVIKKDGRREPYERKKLERSIGVASKGRGPTDRAVAQLAVNIADAVETELSSQALVTSGQIAATILRCLRDTDHIAALRFASTAKTFVSVEDYETEALGLRA